MLYSFGRFIYKNLFEDYDLVYLSNELHIYDYMFQFEL